MKNQTNTALFSLEQLLGSRMARQEDQLEIHSKDISWHQPALPAAVCYPKSTEEVVEIVNICRSDKLCIVPFGAGTSLEGHIIPQKPSISLDFSQMNQIKSIHVEERDCIVEAGLGKLALNKALAEKGLFFAAGPGIDASMGGIVATAASGANAVKYGTARENIRALKVVTAQGEVVETGRRVKKSSAGYNLTQLMIGSEGTLGIITEITAILNPIPAYSAIAMVAFPGIRQALQAAMQMIQEQLPLAMLEFMDELMLQILNDYAEKDFVAKPSLMLELHCEEEMADLYQGKLIEIIERFGGQHLRWAASEEERSELWKVRYDSAIAIKELRPGGIIVPTDVCLPLSMLADFMEATKADLQDVPIQMPFLGHVGDGNFHIVPNLLMDQPEELELFQKINEKLIHKALAMGGTCTGEHGVGIGKKKYLEIERGPAAMGMMKAIKDALDPMSILNPGKIVG